MPYSNCRLPFHVGSHLRPVDAPYAQTANPARGAVMTKWSPGNSSPPPDCPANSRSAYSPRFRILHGSARRMAYAAVHRRASALPTPRPFVHRPSSSLLELHRVQPSRSPRWSQSNSRSRNDAVTLRQSCQVHRAMSGSLSHLLPHPPAIGRSPGPRGQSAPRASNDR